MVRPEGNGSVAAMERTAAVAYRSALVMAAEKMPRLVRTARTSN